jgi:hypothetical protein
LGIGIRDANGQLKTADKLLLSVSDRLNKIKDPSVQRKILSELGLSEAFYKNFLSYGSMGIQDLQKRASKQFIFSDKDIESFREFNTELRLISQTIKNLKDELGTKLLPIFTKIIKPINEFFKANREWLSLKISSFVQLLVDDFEKLKNTFKAVKFVFFELMQAAKGFEIIIAYLLVPAVVLLGRVLKNAFMAHPVIRFIALAYLGFKALY